MAFSNRLEIVRSTLMGNADFSSSSGTLQFGKLVHIGLRQLVRRPLSCSILGSPVLSSQQRIAGFSRCLPQKAQTGSYREKQCQCSALLTVGEWTPERLSLDLAHSWTHRLNPQLVNRCA